MRRATLEMRIAVMNQVLSEDEESLATFEGKAADAEADARTAMDAYEATGLDSAREGMLADFSAALEEYVTLRDERLFPAGRAGDLATWAVARDDSQADILSMMDTLASMVELEKADAAAAVKASTEAYGANRTEVLVLLLLGLTLAVAIGIGVARSIVRGINRVRDVSGALAEGDLTHLAGLTSRDEVGTMGGSLDAAVERLRGIVGTIDASAGSLASATEQMAGTSPADRLGRRGDRARRRGRRGRGRAGLPERADRGVRV